MTININAPLKVAAEDQQALFVYGTLRPSLTKLECPPLLSCYLSVYEHYPAILQGNYKLVTTDLLLYPFLINCQEFNTIQGELCLVDKNDDVVRKVFRMELSAGYEPQTVEVTVCDTSFSKNKVKAIAFLYSKEWKDKKYPFYDICKNEEGSYDYKVFYRNKVEPVLKSKQKGRGSYENISFNRSDLY